MSQFSVVNPSSGRVLRVFESHGDEHIQRMLSDARCAQEKWRNTDFNYRARILSRFKTALLDNADALAMTLTNETGKPISQARGEIRATATRVQYFLDECRAFLRPRVVGPLSFDAPNVAQTEEWVTQHPLGVIANISAWNYPYFVGSNVFVPALLTGNAVLYKPSEFAAMTGQAITRLLHDAGIPEHIFQLVIGGGETGRALVDASIDGVFFTGSQQTGVAIHQQVAGRCIPIQLELGGKDPAYVMADADVRAAARALADGAFYNNGQSCCAVERIYVHHSNYFEFRKHFVEAVLEMKIGDPALAETYLGPLTRPQHIAHLEGQIADALGQGATLLTGGNAIQGDGSYFEPTVLEGVTHEMKVMRDETFGPVIGLVSVGDDNEAINLMNDSSYGLTASIYGQDRTQASALLGQLNAGTVYWNCCDRVSPNTPWTGWGLSGLGSTLSDEGIRAFLKPKAWHFRGV